MTPMKAEMLDDLNRLIKELMPDLFPGVIFLTPKEKQRFFNTIRALIEKHGDGGPKVTTDFILNLYDAKDPTEVQAMLRSIGVQVEGWPMNAIEIIKVYLKNNGYDGLCSRDHQCGCGKDDLCPPGADMCDLSHCVPARRKIVTKEDIDEESAFEIGDEIFVEE